MSLINIIDVNAIVIYFGIFLFTKKANKEVEEEKDEQIHNDLLCRFVTDASGKKIGESVSIDEDIIIIKSGSKFLGVPLKHIKETKKNIIVKGVFDFDKAYEMGEKWRKSSFNEIDNEPKGNDNGV